MKRFIQRWLGIPQLNQRIIDLEEIAIAPCKVSIDEDVSAEVQALNNNKEYMKSVLSEGNNDR